MNSTIIFLYLINICWSIDVYFVASNTDNQTLVNFDIPTFAKLSDNITDFRFDAMNSKYCQDPIHSKNPADNLKHCEVLVGINIVGYFKGGIVGNGVSRCETMVKDNVTYVRSIYEYPRQYVYNQGFCGVLVIKKPIGDWVTSGCSETYSSMPSVINNSNIDKQLLYKRMCCINCNPILDNSQISDMFGIQIETKRFSCYA